MGFFREFPQSTVVRISKTVSTLLWVKYLWWLFILHQVKIGFLKDTCPLPPILLRPAVIKRFWLYSVPPSRLIKATPTLREKCLSTEFKLGEPTHYHIWPRRVEDDEWTSRRVVLDRPLTTRLLLLIKYMISALVGAANWSSEGGLLPSPQPLLTLPLADRSGVTSYFRLPQPRSSEKAEHC